MSNKSDAIITLSADEALVFFDFLARFNESRADHGPEVRVLRMIEATLEAQLSEPFAKDYASLVDQAKARLSAADAD